MKLLVLHEGSDFSSPALGLVGHYCHLNAGTSLPSERGKKKQKWLLVVSVLSAGAGRLWSSIAMQICGAL